MLRDEKQEEWRGRMRDPKYREAIGVLQRVLWEQYIPLNVEGRWRLYQANTQPVRTELLPNGDFHDVDRLDENIVSSVFIIQYDATQRIASKQTMLKSGENYVTVTPEAGAQSYRVAIRFATRPVPAAGFAELVEVSVRGFPQS